MASGESEPSASIIVSDELREWLEAEATRQGVPVDEFVRQVLTAHRAAAEDSMPAGEITIATDDHDDRIEDLRREFMELIEDVRERVIQVKREVDAKAPADHEHPEHLEAIEAIEQRVDDLEDSVDALREDLTAGFQNYEDVLEYLVETTDDLESRSETLGRATLSAREQLREVVGDQQRQEAVTELQRVANRMGVDDANCENCGESVRVSLLTDPKCPHCSNAFTDIEAKTGLRGLFSAATLKTGDRPALTGTTRPEIDEELEASLEDSDRRSADDVSWGSVGEQHD